MPLIRSRKLLPLGRGSSQGYIRKRIAIGFLFFVLLSWFVLGAIIYIQARAYSSEKLLMQMLNHTREVRHEGESFFKLQSRSPFVIYPLSHNSFKVVYEKRKSK